MFCCSYFGKLSVISAADLGNMFQKYYCFLEGSLERELSLESWTFALNSSKVKQDDGNRNMHVTLFFTFLIITYLSFNISITEIMRACVCANVYVCVCVSDCVCVWVCHNEWYSLTKLKHML